jgi:uncharacterized tellurite resistance protein B-like protein
MAGFLDKILRLQSQPRSSTSPADSREKVKIATCALLIEIANSDDHFSNDEKLLIVNTLKTQFGLSDSDAEELLQLAARKLEESSDTWTFTNDLNKNLSEQEKIAIIENIWRIIYSDDHLSHYEDALVHKLSFLLGLSHNQLIETKLKVRPL